jgi:alkanesulfonate monooxygenase SsuD/methylene tetrahydromethanopterin reductase-like flavin-dependent oxidoreductase (luciferase family)
MRALRAALSQREPAYKGEYYEFDGFLVDPSAVQSHLPMWVGGRTFRSLRRAVDLGDGWAPFGLRTAELGEMLGRVERPAGFNVILQNEHPLDPITEPDRVGEQLERFRAIGATGINARFVHHSRAHYCEQLAALAAIVGVTPSD